jgi:CTP:phosphocholine cytidylyltransferase-like protein/thiamine kinase-like enzyme
VNDVSLQLSDPEFRVLRALVTGDARTQRDLGRAAGLSVGAVNSALRHLKERGLADADGVTEAGRQALEPYKVDNAIIMAAGMSTRFAPLSWEKPKGLLEVKGERLVERLIRQLQAAGIPDITVVVGYMMEQFLYLEDDFGVKIAVNREYDQRNNNSTLKLVAGQLGNTYICSSDNYYAENVFQPYVHHGYYAAVYAEGPTDEWVLTTGPQDRIVKAKPGGRDGWIMLGEAYFDRAFSRRFAEVLDEVYDRPETKPKLWEEIYADHIKGLDLRIRRYPPDVVYEFDTLDELRAFDPDFIDNIDSSILDHICVTLDVSRSDLTDFEPIREGLSNLSFRFAADGEAFVYRHPGQATQGILNRRAEAEAEAIAHELGLDRSFIYLDPETGWKISRFIPVSEHFDYHNERHVAGALDLIRQLHTSGRTIGNDFDIFAELGKIKARLLPGGTAGAGRRLGFPDFGVLDRRATALYEAAQTDGFAPVLCHDDFYDANLLVRGEDMYLIDWEYSGMSDFASDLGTFICCSDYTWDEALHVFDLYFGRSPTSAELRHCVAYVSLASYYWFVWALHKDACGEPVGDYTYLWYRFAKEYGERAATLYGIGN